MESNTDTNNENSLSGDGVKVSSSISASSQLVDELFKFRDNYYENKKISDTISSQKVIDVQQKLNETVEELNKLIWNRDEKSFYHLYIGKALNVVADYNPECQDNLSKAIKLNPKLSEAWYQLGECHWKNNDVEGAYNCFQSALEHQTDKHILRSISMVLRQLPSSQEERRTRLAESVRTAKEALKLDMQDGKSWAVLGSAYLNSFLANPFNPKSMSHSLTAYQKAVRDPVAYTDPDLHYNYGIALLYESNFSKCLEQWLVSACLDYAWKFPKESIAQTLLFLDCLLISIRTKGKMKEKRFRQLLSALKEPKTRIKDMGPYSDGKLGSTIEMKSVKFSDLKEGGNANTMVFTKVVCGAVQGDKLAYTIVVTDDTGSIWPVRIFNLAQGKGPVIGDSLVLPEPFVERLSVNADLVNKCHNDISKNEAIFKFEHDVISDSFRQSGVDLQVVRVSIPSILVVNGRKVNSKWTALPVVQNLYFTDNWLSSLN